MEDGEGRVQRAETVPPGSRKAGTKVQDVHNVAVHPAAPGVLLPIGTSVVPEY